MYTDNMHTTRNGFRYEYTGAELLSFAKDKLNEMCAKERAARELVIRLTRDPGVNPSDRRVEEAKRDVVSTATVVEELSVHVHQFAREKDRKFAISLGDVVFFGLIAKDITEDVRVRITPSA